MKFQEGFIFNLKKIFFVGVKIFLFTIGVVMILGMLVLVVVGVYVGWVIFFFAKFTIIPCVFVIVGVLVGVLVLILVGVFVGVFASVVLMGVLHVSVFI